MCVKCNYYYVYTSLGSYPLVLYCSPCRKIAVEKQKLRPLSLYGTLAILFATFLS